MIKSANSAIGGAPPIILRLAKDASASDRPADRGKSGGKRSMRLNRLCRYRIGRRLRPRNKLMLVRFRRCKSQSRQGERIAQHDAI
jgi:hypothetical protein